MKEITAYRCDYCGKLYRRGKTCTSHEAICAKNSVNFTACFGCKYLTKAEVETTIFGFNGYCEVEEDVKVRVCVCTKNNAHMIPPKIQRKGEWYDVVRDTITGKELKTEFMQPHCDHRATN